YFGFGKAMPEEKLVFGPNIADWPEMEPLPEDLLLRVASVIRDPVTTTDELIPSGETSSYRSNPLKLAEFALSRKDPAYVERAKAVQKMEKSRLSGLIPEEVSAVLVRLGGEPVPERIGIGSLVCAVRPGDGSAREQAASCQKVLGGWANLAVEYATKRYRSNLINWGMLPLVFSDAEEGRETEFSPGDWIFLPGIREAVRTGAERIPAKVLKDGPGETELSLTLGTLTDEERQIILDGCLINHYNR
ncbi:MAG: hydratase, partial [Clostridia bacterium]|nr:hydratase [Clostridia bacterium]